MEGVRAGAGVERAGGRAEACARARAGGTACAGFSPDGVSLRAAPLCPSDVPPGLCQALTYNCFCFV